MPRARASSSSRATSSGARCGAIGRPFEGTGRRLTACAASARRRCRREARSICGRGSSSSSPAPRGRQDAPDRAVLPGAPPAAHDRVAHAAAALAARAPRTAAARARDRRRRRRRAPAARRDPRRQPDALGARGPARALPGGGATRDARSISRRGSSARARALSLSLSRLHQVSRYDVTRTIVKAEDLAREQGYLAARARDVVDYLARPPPASETAI